MVRCLVASAVREAILEAARYPCSADALLRIAAERDRTASAAPAPPQGLCFYEAGYVGSFDATTPQLVTV
jgi:tRNA U38,U39,U40 pseudouridine synthase TruA